MECFRLRPAVRLIGEDGNAFSILGRCHLAAREAGWCRVCWESFLKAATSDGYDHLLRTVMEHFEVE